MNRIASLVDRPIIACYSDSGMVGSKNPSDLGVSWAWCHVVKPGIRSVYASGVITPAELGFKFLGNNLGEFAAAARCLRALPDGWSGEFGCDSRITLGRLFEGWEADGLPPGWVQAARANLERLGEVRPVLIAGHPTKRDLAAGKKGDLSVSLHNVWCDEECTRVARAYLEKLEKEPEARTPRPAHRSGPGA